MSWPTCPKSKKLVKLIEESERTLFGEEKEVWSPRTDHDHQTILKRVHHLLDELGHNDKKHKKLYEQVRTIAHNLGISFWDESEEESDSEDNLETPTTG
tara:strand:+ start:17 stop:313 length:297 start_codon:yes stop_codon:yes gene_type:complete